MASHGRWAPVLGHVATTFRAGEAVAAGSLRAGQSRSCAARRGIISMSTSRRRVSAVQIGLTGGIGSGKSTAAGRFAELGALVIDADALAREVVEPGTDGLAAVVAEFGEQVLDGAGRLDRPALARVVFGDEAARGRLNAILHPRIRARAAELIAAAPAGTVVVQDVPLLVETGQAGAYELVVVVEAPRGAAGAAAGPGPRHAGGGGPGADGLAGHRRAAPCRRRRRPGQRRDPRRPARKGRRPLGRPRRRHSPTSRRSSRAVPPETVAARVVAGQVGGPQASVRTARMRWPSPSRAAISSSGWSAASAAASVASSARTAGWSA